MGLGLPPPSLPHCLCPCTYDLPCSSSSSGSWEGTEVVAAQCTRSDQKCVAPPGDVTSFFSLVKKWCSFGCSTYVSVEKSKVILPPFRGQNRGGLRFIGAHSSLAQDSCPAAVGSVPSQQGRSSGQNGMRCSQAQGRSHSHGRSHSQVCTGASAGGVELLPAGCVRHGPRSGGDPSPWLCLAPVVPSQCTESQLGWARPGPGCAGAVPALAGPRHASCPALLPAVKSSGHSQDSSVVAPRLVHGSHGLLHHALLADLVCTKAGAPGYGPSWPLC